MSAIAHPTNVGVATSPHLTYYGGKVLKSPTFSSIFLGSFWNSTTGKSQSQYLNRMATTVLNSRHVKIWEEYGGGKPTFSGSTVTPLATQPKAITDRLVQRVVEDAIKRGAVQANGAESVYTVFLPPGIELLAPDGTSSRMGMGGYHHSFTANNGQKVYYAAIAYAEGGNGISFTPDPLKNMSIAATHEWFEAVTDPDVNNGRLGWYDQQYGEVGDIPIATSTRLKDTFGFIGGFAVQKEWSNRDGRSELTPRSRYK
ncbi:MAG: hypothetical protein EBZ48_13645 [Proteobacteria bacterium]|nr:hypothetical protein [Pseudomonadota bacterium]